MKKMILYRCISCARGYACEIGDETRQCEDCRENHQKCRLLEINKPFDIYKGTCKEHREGVYGGINTLIYMQGRSPMKGTQSYEKEQSSMKRRDR